MAFLDLVKLMTIYLVILGHVVIMIDRNLSVGGELYRFIYTFHMQLFMLLSGYFVSSSFTKPFQLFVSEKARRLLIPTMSCKLITCFYLL